ncbi:MAG: alpha/beta hydrolase [Gemmatimonadetes bacterium]|nr:alpha/beta hydrolase [Gemmatimonadota bacterium]
MPLPIPEPAREGFTTITPVPLYWAAWGRSDAPRLVLLHGGPGAHLDYLLPQMLHLAERFEVIMYDQRGGGKSKVDTPAPITWRTHADDFFCVMAELGIGSVPVVGYSWGAMLAMLTAMDAFDVALPAPVIPEGTTAAPTTDAPRVRPSRLALLDPAPITRAWRQAFDAEFSRRMQGPAVTALRDELAQSGLKERDPDAYRQRAFELSVAGYFADPRRARDLTPFRVTGRVQQSTWASLGEFDLTPSLWRVRVPSLVVHGAADPIPLASSEACARALGAEFVVIPDAGHVPYVEAPGPLFAALDRFLDG